MKKKLILAVCLGLAILLGLGVLANVASRIDDSEMKDVVIRYVIAGETDPFDTYVEKHIVGEEIRIASPSILGGYTPRIPVYTAVVKSDMNVTVSYDFKAPDVPARENAVLYRADFNNVDSYEEAFNQDGIWKAVTVGSLNNNYDFDFSNNMLHSSSFGRIELDDQQGVFSKESYTVSFSMLFEKFDEKSVATAISWSYANYNGGSTGYSKAMRLDTSGKVYLNDATHVTSLQTNKWYTFTIYVNNEDLTCELFIDGVSFGHSEMKDPNNSSQVSFRLFNTDSHTEYYLDNLVIYEGTPVKK